MTVVGEQAIAERPSLTVADHIRSQPGVDVSSGGLVQSNIVARGFNNAFSGSLLTLIDNRFASVPSLRVNVPFLFTTSNEDIERVEVVLGPAAALYGPNSANGVLHIITKSPFTSEGSTLTLDAGERSVVRLAGRHARAFNDQFAMKLTGEFMRGGDWEFRDPAEPDVFPATPNTPTARVGQANVRNYDIERYGGEARLDWRLGENTEWINTYGITNGGSAIELTGANGTGQISDWRMQSLQSRLRSGPLFAQVFANFSDAGNSDSTDLSGTYLLRTGQPIVDQSRTLAAQAQYSFGLGARTSLVSGVDYILTNPRTGGTINGRNEEDDNTSEIGGYLQSTTAVTPQWDVLFAARLDQHNQLVGTFFSPRAAVVYKPTPEQSVRLTFNRAYSTPANFSFFLDLLQAGNSAFGGLPFNVRAVGVPQTGFTFRRDCTGGVGSLCMRSPFTPAAAGGGATFVPANAAAYYQAALNVALAGGLQSALAANPALGAPGAQAVVDRLRTFNAVTANVGTSLRYITTPGAPPVSPASVVDLERLKASFTNVLELGYKGVIGNRVYFAADAWYQRRENFITPAANFTPNALLDGASLGAGLAAHLTPVIGAAAAAQVAGAITPTLAGIPLGTVVPDSRVTTNGDIAFTYQSIDKAINLRGADVAFDLAMTDAVHMLGSYSWVSDVVFPDIPSGQRPLTLNAPDHKGSLAFKYTHAPRNFSGELRGRYQNTYPVNSAVFVTGVDLRCASPASQTCANAHKGPSTPAGFFQYQQPPTAMFLDLSGSWRLPFQTTRQALLAVTATNLLDNRVPMFAGVPEIGRLIMTRLQFTF
ncbi:MAG: TonB-dependent receptor [Gemmatimonadaceae bacterium]|nr:TonB-dependent receptor [Gemmatimonadaceae bacterium]